MSGKRQTASVVDVHALAHDIEHACACRVVRAQGPRPGPRRTFKERVAAEFDPHAATELAGLIARRLGLPH